MTVEPASAITDISWPAIPAPNDALILALFRQMADSEWRPAEWIQHRQLDQLRVVARHAATTVPFYRQKFLDANLDLDEFDWEEWRSFPILTRRDIQTAKDDLLSQSISPTHGAPVSSTTAGSTGAPVTTFRTAVTNAMANAICLREHIWHNRDLDGKLAFIRDYDGRVGASGRKAVMWDYAAGLLRPRAPAAHMDVWTPSHIQAAWLAEENPDYLRTTPSNVAELIRQIQALGLKLPNLKAVITFGEMVTEDLRETCRNQWGVAIEAQYSTCETSIIGLQAPDGDHYLVQSENVVVEIVDDDGAPCPEGQPGRVIVTTLHNFAMPLLRYEIGDIAQWGPPDPAGRGLPVISKVWGRVRNTIALPGGGRAWPHLHTGTFVKIAPINRFQITQETLTHATFKVVPEDRPLTRKERDALATHLDVQFGGGFTVDVVEVDSLSVGPGGKTESLVSLVPPTPIKNPDQK